MGPADGVFHACGKAECIDLDWADCEIIFKFFIEYQEYSPQAVISFLCACSGYVSCKRIVAELQKI